MLNNESMCSIFAGPQSPCERTDLRMAIVADHLGLSWTGEDALLKVCLEGPVYTLHVHLSSLQTCDLLPSSGAFM